MRQTHLAGGKLFVDCAGMKARIVDATTGEITEVELFVAGLGASNYTNADATRTQQVADCVGSVVRAPTFLGGAHAMPLRRRTREIRNRPFEMPGGSGRHLPDQGLRARYRSA